MKIMRQGNELIYVSYAINDVFLLKNLIKIQLIALNDNQVEIDYKTLRTALH